MWAIEQDELSKRNVPTASTEASDLDSSASGQDVFVPWVLAQPQETKPKARRRGKTEQQEAQEVPTPTVSAPKVFDRYYHMFAKGELNDLVVQAASNMGLVVGEAPTDADYLGGGILGMQIVQDGWERSNYYVELRCWEQ